MILAYVTDLSNTETTTDVSLFEFGDKKSSNIPGKRLVHDHNAILAVHYKSTNEKEN